MSSLIIGKKRIKNICIVGGGNEGLYFLALLGSRDDLSVSLLTRRPELFGRQVTRLRF